MSKRVQKEFRRCGSIVTSTDLGTYLSICEGALKDEKPFFGDVISQILPIGIQIIHYNSSRFSIIEGCVFKLSSGEYVRIHWHTEDFDAPIGSNAYSNKIIRVNVNEDHLVLGLDKSVSLKRIDNTSLANDINDSHIKVYYCEEL